MSSRCCGCMKTGKCLRCPCARSGNPCVDCYARKHGVCQNGAPSSSSGSLPTLLTRHGQEEALPSPTSPVSIDSAKTTAILDSLQLEAFAVSCPSFQTSAGRYDTERYERYDCNPWYRARLRYGNGGRPNGYRESRITCTQL